MADASIAHDVSGTAFVVNLSRARQVALSGDEYAHLWVTPETQALWDELAREVYPHDDVSLSLRNRFYLTRLRAFVAAHPTPTFVNLGAGFTSYPQLVDARCRSIEVDLPGIVTYKRDRVDAWVRDGLLPLRPLTFHAADLMQPVDLDALATALVDWCAGPSFVLMEGLVYYLARPALDRLFAMLARAQQPGSVVAFEYWPTDADRYGVYRRLETYLARRFGRTAHGYTLLDAADVRAIAGYDVAETSDIAAEERAHAPTRVLQGIDDRLPIEFVVLRRSATRVD
jgi:O-methyltransferase involved in polyketide biosynthesis